MPRLFGGSPRLSLIRRALCGGLVAVFVTSLPAAAGSLAVTLPHAPGCPIFPANNVWNMPVDSLPVAEDSARLMSSIGMGAYLHPDFSSIDGGNYGIPYNVVGSA